MCTGRRPQREHSGACACKLPRRAAAGGAAGIHEKSARRAPARACWRSCPMGKVPLKFAPPGADPSSRVVYHNPRFEDMHAPVAGPSHPFHNGGAATRKLSDSLQLRPSGPTTLSPGQVAQQKNHPTGYVEVRRFYIHPYKYKINRAPVSVPFPPALLHPALWWLSEISSPFILRRHTLESLHSLSSTTPSMPTAIRRSPPVTGLSAALSRWVMLAARALICRLCAGSKPLVSRNPYKSAPSPGAGATHNACRA